jgi:hypothetical protein
MHSTIDRAGISLNSTSHTTYELMLERGPQKPARLLIYLKHERQILKFVMFDLEPVEGSFQGPFAALH